MAKYGPDDLKIEFDNSGGSLVDMSDYVNEINDVSKEAILQEVTAFGDTDEAWAAVGVSRVAPITLGGFYDDTASTGPDAIFNAIGQTRTLKLTWGGDKTTSVECIIQSYTRRSVTKELTRYTVGLQPTGAVTEA